MERWVNAKRKGTAREHASKHLLEALGYVVIRAAGSHGVFDLVAICATDILLVQVKSRDLPGPLEREALEAFSAPANCRKLVHRWKDRQRLPEVVELS